MINGRYFTRNELIEMHSEYFEQGSKGKVIQLNQVGKNQLDVKIHIKNENGDLFQRKLFTVNNGKVVTTMKYTATLASMYPNDSAKSTRPRYYYAGSTIVECEVASDRKTQQKSDQMKHFFIDKKVAACNAFQKIRIKPQPQTCSAE